MTATAASPVMRNLRTLFHLGVVADLTDGQLLERFATRPDATAELAFEALVERHGPMVLGVCRGVLGDPHDADDAFQATFLVLARRAGSLWVRDSLGPWLYAVAGRVATRARADAARRRRVETSLAGDAEAVAPGSKGPDDSARVLHEEIARLPEKYRAAVVLCHLEGRTHEEAARHLRCPVGTVKVRLMRARERLRGRLARRGVVPSAGLLVAESATPTTSAALAPSLVEATVRAAASVVKAGAGKAAVAPAVAAAAEAMLRAMKLTAGLKAGTAVAAVGLFAGAFALAFLPQGEDKSKEEPKAKHFVYAPVESKAGDRELNVEFAVFTEEQARIVDRVHQEIAQRTHRELLEMAMAQVEWLTRDVVEQKERLHRTEELLDRARDRLKGLREKLAPAAPEHDGGAAPAGPTPRHEEKLDDISRKLDRVLKALDAARTAPRP
jgi:RNA polymerase sigma factor (sigma-70 family)